MSFMKLLVIVALVGGGYYAYTQKQREKVVQEAEVEVVSANGFLALPTVNGGGAAVLVIAAEGCPLEDAARADQLAADLQGKGVPVQRTHNVGFTLTSPDPAAVQRMQSVMNGALPIVIVRGRGKANPTLNEVLAEYRDRR